MATEPTRQNPTVFSDTSPKYLSQRYAVTNQITTIRRSVRGFTAKK
jgi:hypothetical protein